MATKAAKIGDWYMDITLNQSFEVVAIDESSSCIEIQYIDGDIAEYDLESWNELPLEHAEAPEDASAGYALSAEDSHLNDQVMMAYDSSDPLRSIEPENYTEFDEF